MKEINISQAVKLTSPNPLTLICTENKDFSTNIAPVSFVSFFSFNPPVMGFAMGKSAYTGERIRQTGKAIITIPGTSLAEAVMHCGSTSGRTIDKVSKFNIKLTRLRDTAIQIPVETRLAFITSLHQVVEVGNHDLYICNIEKIYGDESKEALFAWSGYQEAAPAVKKIL